MEDTAQQFTASKADRPRFNPVLLVLVLLGIGLVVALALNWANKQKLNQEIASAKQLSDRTLHDIKTQNGADARSFADASFRKQYPADALSTRFRLADQVLKGTPTLDRRTLVQGSKNDTVFFIYKYRNGGAAYYIRTGISNSGKNHTWQLIDIESDTDESHLLIK
ncbi:MAG TPA: hypothetical protein VFH39_01160 [Candidatus Saccharimonadales bacterium]|nr:hypothetical protein [Candidatus Saccharimonadales bacterium]